MRSCHRNSIRPPAQQGRLWLLAALATTLIAVAADARGADAPAGSSSEGAEQGDSALVLSIRGSANARSPKWSVDKDGKPLEQGEDYHLIDGREVQIPKIAPGKYDVSCSIEVAESGSGSRVVKLKEGSQSGKTGDDSPPGAAPSGSSDEPREPVFDSAKIGDWARGWLIKHGKEDAALRTTAWSVARDFEELAFKAPALASADVVAEFGRIERCLVAETEDRPAAAAWDGFFRRLKSKLQDNDFDAGSTADWQQALRKLAGAIEDSLEELENAPAPPPPPWPQEKLRPPVVEPGEVSSWLPWGIFILGLTLLAVGVFWVWVQAPEAIVRDSPQFRGALAVWHPLLNRKCKTPRAVKRFMNRLRFFAMRRRAQTPEPSHREYILETLRAWLRLNSRESARSADAVEIDERMLVALCVITQFDSRWIDDESLWSRLRRGLPATRTRSPISQEDYKLLRDQIRAHRAEFHSWNPTDDDRKRLLSTFREVRAF
ncbi:MAG: hypothetical protein HQ582_29310 [Planctomycetes bacterium]|nr:hypothetical protein [Planctomycetota bacterium]